MTIEVLARRAFDAFNDASSRVGEVVVKPSVPILFFGDEPAFRASRLRIITVALNPSRIEFPASDPFSRFGSAAALLDLGSDDRVERYLSALRHYFDASQDPYKRWFASYESLLEGMDASYYAGRTNVALHTDLCSPVATDPTWSGLSPRQRSVLMRSGRQLWHDLVVELKPHVVLISVARSHLAEIQFKPITVGSELVRIERDRPYSVTRRSFRIDDDHSTLLISGQAAQTPFGSVSIADKRRIGAAIKAAVDV